MSLEAPLVELEGLYATFCQARRVSSQNLRINFDEAVLPRQKGFVGVWCPVDRINDAVGIGSKIQAQQRHEKHRHAVIFLGADRTSCKKLCIECHAS